MDPAARSDSSDSTDLSSARTFVLLAGLLAGCATLFGLGLGSTDLWAPDEPRYAAIAEELRSWRHGWRGLFLLHLNDEVYTQKPPLYFWLAAALGAPGGQVTEVAARLPSVLAGLASVALTFLIGMRLFRSSVTALLAGGLLATSFRFAYAARRAQLDVLLTSFLLIAIALFLFVDSRIEKNPRDSRLPLAVGGLHLALGAAALVKGPVAWLPFAIFAAYSAWNGRGQTLRMIAPLWAWCLSLGPLVLWAVIAIVLAPAGFADEAIGRNVIDRFFSGSSHVRPFYYFLYHLPLEYLPWTFVLPLGLVWLVRSARNPFAVDVPQATHPAARFLICWIAIPFLFFSVSAGKRGVYLLPIFPALALVTAAGLNSARGLTGWLGGSSRRPAMAVAAVAVLELALFAGVAPLWLDGHKSPRPIAQGIARHSAPGERIGIYGLTPIEGAIGYYGDRSVDSLADEDELARFLARGGSLVLLRTRHLSELPADIRLLEIEAFRAGRRRLSLARARPTRLPAGQSDRVGQASLPRESGRTGAGYTRAFTPLSALPAPEINGVLR